MLERQIEKQHFVQIFEQNKLQVCSDKEVEIRGSKSERATDH